MSIVGHNTIVPHIGVVSGSGIGRGGIIEKRSILLDTNGGKLFLNVGNGKLLAVRPA